MLDDSEFGRSEELLNGFIHEREHPDVEQSVVDELDIVTTLAQAIDQEGSSSEFQEMFSKVLMLVEVNKARNQTILGNQVLFVSKSKYPYFF